MAKRTTTRGRRSTSTVGGRGNSNRTVSRSNNSGVGRGRRPKSMEEYIEEDLEGQYEDDDQDAGDFYQTLQQDAEEYDVDRPRVVSRARPGDRRIGNQFGRANRGRGQNQYTVNNNGGGRGANRGGRGDSAARIRDLINEFADNLISELE